MNTINDLHDLPDDIIIKILSFLSIDKAALTSILSKRWRDLFAFTPNLHISLTTRTKSLSSFMDFVERVLVVSGNSVIRSFTLKLNCQLTVDPAHTNRWIRNVLKRGGVLDLDLEVLGQELLVFDVLACKTLVNLNLTRVKIPMLSDNASLPALKSLSLYFVIFDNLGAFEKLISACPLLEEFINFQSALTFRESFPFLPGPTLKKLTTHFHGNELGSMSFDTPNLVHLDYSGYLQLQYPLVNLDSLVEANLEIVMKDGNHSNCNPTNLFKGLRNVKVLSLYYPATVEGPLCGHNVTEYVCECFSENSCVLSSPVKVLELTKYKGSSRELVQIKRFLEKLSCLELVNVCGSADNDMEKLRITTDLLMLPRASSKCRIQVQFS